MLTNAISFDNKIKCMINTVISHTKTSLLSTANEDGSITLFEFTTNNITNNLPNLNFASIRSLVLSKFGL